MSREALVKKLFFRFVLFLVPAQLLIVREEVVGDISARTMALISVALFVGGFSFLWIGFSKIARDNPIAKRPQEELNNPIARKRLLRGLRALQVVVAMLAVSFVLGVLDSKGEPLLPTLVGATVNLLLTYGVLHAVRNQKRRIEQFEANSLAAPNSEPRPS